MDTNTKPEPMTHIDLTMDQIMKTAAAVAYLLSMANMLLTTLSSGQFDAALAHLQRLRQLLEMFTATAERHNAVPPIKALDHLARKEFPNIGSMVTAAHIAVGSASIMQVSVVMSLEREKQRAAAHEAPESSTTTESPADLNIEGRRRTLN